MGREGVQRWGEQTRGNLRQEIAEASTAMPKSARVFSLRVVFACTTAFDTQETQAAPGVTLTHHPQAGKAIIWR